VEGMRAAAVDLLSRMEGVYQQHVLGMCARLREALELPPDADPADFNAGQASILHMSSFMHGMGAFMLELSRLLAALQQDRATGELAFDLGPAVYVHAHGVQPMVPQSINFSSFGAGGMGGAGPFLFTHPNMQMRVPGGVPQQAQANGAQARGGAAPASARAPAPAPAPPPPPGHPSTGVTFRAPPQPGTSAVPVASANFAINFTATAGPWGPSAAPGFAGGQFMPSRIPPANPPSFPLSGAAAGAQPGQNTVQDPGSVNTSNSPPSLPVVPPPSSMPPPPPPSSSPGVAPSTQGPPADVPPASSSAVPGPALLGELLSLVQGISGNPALLDDAAGARPSPAAQPGSDQALSAMLQELAASTLGPGMDIQAMEMFAEPHPFQHAQAASSVAGAQGPAPTQAEATANAAAPVQPAPPTSTVQVFLSSVLDSLLSPQAGATVGASAEQGSAAAAGSEHPDRTSLSDDEFHDAHSDAGDWCPSAAASEPPLGAQVRKA